MTGGTAQCALLHKVCTQQCMHACGWRHEVNSNRCASVNRVWAVCVGAHKRGGAHRR